MIMDLARTKASKIVYNRTHEKHRGANATLCFHKEPIQIKYFRIFGFSSIIPILYMLSNLSPEKIFEHIIFLE